MLNAEKNTVIQAVTDNPKRMKKLATLTRRYEQMDQAKKYVTALLHDCAISASEAEVYDIAYGICKAL